MSDLTLRQLEYAVATADAAHFGHAAAAVNVTQPGLSAQIAELERKLGVALFERTSRRVQVSAAGRELIERARSILQAVRDLEIAASMNHGTLHGTLAVGAIPTMAPYLLPRLSGVLRARWPEATLQLHELRTAELVAAIDSGEVDIGLLALPVNTSTLHTEIVGHDEFVLALPAGHAQAKRSPASLELLRDLPVLVLAEGHCLREHALDACALAGQVDHHEVRSASLTTLAQMVTAGTGVTLLPESCLAIEARPGTGLAIRRFRKPAPGRTVALAWRATDPRNALFQAVAKERITL